MSVWAGKLYIEMGTYPCVVELCLQADVFSFLLILRSQYLQLLRLQRRLNICSVYQVLALRNGLCRSVYSHGSDGDMTKMKICVEYVYSVATVQEAKYAEADVSQPKTVS